MRGPQGPQDAAQITGYDGRLRDLVLPGELDGLPVRSIAGHAFEHRRDLCSASLPGNLKTLRAFAFYGCTSLTSMELYNTTDDYYDGVIRQCPSLRSITVHCVRADDFVIVRDMLSDVDGTLSFRLLTPQGEIRLTFPDYLNEAKEDTMARAIHFSIEGAGMAYRECVGKKKLDLAAYDRLLGRLTDYDFDVAARIAFGRLACPVGLQERFEKGYEVFLKENDRKALTGLIGGGAAGAGDANARRGSGSYAAPAGGGDAGRMSAEKEMERRESLNLLIDRQLIGRDALEEGLSLASANGETEICSLLMDYRSRAFPAGTSQTFSLDWL